MSGVGKMGALFALALAALFGGAGTPGGSAGSPRNHRNGGARSGVASARRRRTKRRNIAKHPRGAA